jgi:glycosyltransferase involved in cell wall biosynthesis
MRALARGTPTVVNDHGSFKELPAEAVIKVETGASPQQVARVLESALFDKEVRERLRDAALRYAEEVSFENIIDRFWEEIVLAA